MLSCSYPPLHPIRVHARKEQQTVADRLKTKLTAPRDHYFIDHFLYASWVQPSAHTKRIWLGLWTNDMLALVFPPAFNLLSPLSLDDRYRYTHIVAKLTAPLTNAYHQMISINHKRHQPTPRNTMSYLPPHTAHRLEALFPQQMTSTVIPRRDACPTLTCISAFAHTHPFTLSDSAFSLTDTEIGNAL
jgi:hypothetical protein